MYVHLSIIMNEHYDNFWEMIIASTSPIPIIILYMYYVMSHVLALILHAYTCIHSTCIHVHVYIYSKQISKMLSKQLYMFI